MELTQRILNSLKGCLYITVTHSSTGDRLRVNGFTDNPVEFGWTDMPEKMKVANRHVYCCKTEDTGEVVWVFADEVQVVDAPADMVVDALMELLWQVNPYTAEVIHRGGDGEVNDEEEDEDEVHCLHPWHEEGGSVYCPKCGADLVNEE